MIIIFQVVLSFHIKCFHMSFSVNFTDLFPAYRHEHGKKCKSCYRDSSESKCALYTSHFLPLHWSSIKLYWPPVHYWPDASHKSPVLLWSGLYDCSASKKYRKKKKERLMHDRNIEVEVAKYSMFRHHLNKCTHVVKMEVSERIERSGVL